MTLNFLWPLSQQGPEWTPKPISVLASKDTKNLYHKCKATLSSKFIKQWLMGEERRKAGEQEEEAAASCTSCARCGISLSYILLHIPGPSCIGLCWKWLRDLPWTGSGLWERSCHKNNFAKQDSALWIQEPSLPNVAENQLKTSTFLWLPQLFHQRCLHTGYPPCPPLYVDLSFVLITSTLLVLRQVCDTFIPRPHLPPRPYFGPMAHKEGNQMWSLSSWRPLSALGQKWEGILSSDLCQAVKHTGVSQGFGGWAGLFLEPWP